MATAVNPKVKYVPSGALVLERVKCAGSNTWKKGEFGVFESGLADPAVTGEIPAFIYAETNDTASTANDLVWVYRLEVGTELEICVVNTTAAAAETAAVIGTDYDLYVASNKHYLEVAGTTDKVFRVLKQGSEYDSAKRTATETPGRVLVKVMKVQA